MPKKKTAETVRRPDAKAPVRQIPAAAVPAPLASIPAVPLVSGFENKVGRYELTRVDGDQAYYSFTNRLGRTADAIMSVTMWQRMQARADATFQETA
jgi:hypothetical protein